MLHQLVEILADGFVIGAIFALGAAGFTMIFGVSGVLNLAHGSIMVIAALVAWFCAEHTPLGIYGGALVGIAASVASTYLLYGLVIRPLNHSKRIADNERPVFVLTATLLVAIILQGVLDYAFGSSPITTPTLIDGVWRVAGVTIPYSQILIGVIAWLVLGALWYFVTRTRPGKAMLAASMSTTGLALVGYDIRKVQRQVWGLYGLLAGIAGVLLASFTGASSDIAISLTVNAFIIVVLGGLGNVAGSLGAAYIIGFLGTLTAYLISPAIREVPGLLALVLILYIRPQGLFGRH
ncbi:branched-chain amino acid ABC transporter permease [Mangrovitalea sediminis]|uniref:branched-chain amino acid ABC transporter permease n=1 Tax=Mangrovitalea sediminis TaxID=1982043 RepID=UPI000BE5D01B|nr:branched-chain amino acid ABC transporter permease [Mangrovitalea sediminis]